MCDAAAQAAFIKSVIEQILSAYCLPDTDHVLYTVIHKYQSPPELTLTGQRGDKAVVQLTVTLAHKF